MPLTIAITPRDAGMYIVALGGSLDSDTTGQLAEEFDSKVWADPKARLIRFELQDLVYISSVGLGLFAKTRKTATQRGGGMVTVGARPQIARVFEIVKMLPKEIVFVSHEEADAYLAAMMKKAQQGDV